MSHEELSNYSSRELLRQTINMLEDQKKELVEHRKESFSFRETTGAQLSKIKTSVAVIESESKEFKKTQDTHNTKISKLETGHNRAKGFIGALTTLGLGAIVEYFRNK